MQKGTSGIQWYPTFLLQPSGVISWDRIRFYLQHMNTIVHL